MTPTRDTASRDAIVARFAAEWRGEEIETARRRRKAAHPVLDAIIDERKARPLPGYGMAGAARVFETLIDPTGFWRVERAVALKQARYCRAAGKPGGYRRAMRRAAELRQNIREWRAGQ